MTRVVKVIQWKILTKDQNFKKDLITFCEKHKAILWKVETMTVDMDEVNRKLNIKNH